MVNPRWYFGGHYVKQQKRFIIPVDARDKATLQPLIRKHIHAGSKINSDEWGAYCDLTSHGWDHVTVNHSKNFVDPVTGAHTQGVERFRNRIKRKLKNVFGPQGDMSGLGDYNVFSDKHKTNCFNSHAH
jgi:hypothetical protein